MTDIFHEIEEEVRRERYEKLWKEYGDYVIAAGAFLVIAAAGWQLWRYYEQRERLRASDEYAAAAQVLESGQSAAAAEAFGKLADSAPSGYAQVSRLQEAGALLASGRTDDALKLYKEIASGRDEILGGVARIRGAWAIADTGSRSDIEAMLGPLTDPSNAWNLMAREVLAYSDYRSGQIKRALAEYKSLSTDRKAPTALHERAAAMAVFLGAGGGVNYGTVPPPTPKPANATPQATPQSAPTK